MNIMRGIRVRVSCQFKLSAGGGNTGSCSTAQWSPHCQWSRQWWLQHCTLYRPLSICIIYLRYNGYPKHGKVMVTLNTEVHKLVSENQPTNCRFCELTKDGAAAGEYWYAHAFCKCH